MTEHKHAAVFRAIADGVPLSEFEITWGTTAVWEPLAHRGGCLFLADSEVRRKLQYITVNGFKVPKPLDVMLVHGVSYYVSRPDCSVFHVPFRNDLDEVDCLMIKRKIAHSTKEAAIAHAKAMLGIDPNAV